MAQTLDGQKAVIVGGGTGVGLACGEALAQLGAEVALIGRRAEKLEQAAQLIGVKASYFVANAHNEAEMREVFERIGIFDHLLIPAAKTDRVGNFVDVLTQDKFRETFEGKFWTQVNAARAGAPFVRKGGSITFFSGAASRKALRGMVNIAAVNGALEAIVPPLALELAPTRVNIIIPGTLDTPYFEGIPDDAKQAIFDRAASVLPVGRVGYAQDIANAAVFLVTTGYVTGTAIEVDGGIRLT
jgi:NAD(P)-dependent dehydrogenase (short-subunit alcohol dehydrogenase family)